MSVAQQGTERNRLSFQGFNVRGGESNTAHAHSWTSWPVLASAAACTCKV